MQNVISFITILLVTVAVSNTVFSFAVLEHRICIMHNAIFSAGITLQCIMCNNNIKNTVVIVSFITALLVTVAVSCAVFSFAFSSSRT